MDAIRQKALELAIIVPGQTARGPREIVTAAEQYRNFLLGDQTGESVGSQDRCDTAKSIDTAPRKLGNVVVGGVPGG